MEKFLIFLKFFSRYGISPIKKEAGKFPASLKYLLTLY